MTKIWGQHEPQAGFPEWDTVNHNPPSHTLTVDTVNGVRMALSEVHDDSIDSRCDAGRYTGVGQILDGWWGWNLLLDSNYKTLTKGHDVIAQLHAQGGYGQFFSLRCRPDDTFQIIRYLREWMPKRETLREGIPMIKGRKFPLKAHLRATQNGILDIWIDGTKVVEKRGDMRSLAPRRAGASIIAGMYPAPNNGNNKMWFGDIICATTEQEVDEWLGEPEEPTVIDVIKILQEFIEDMIKQWEGLLERLGGILEE